MSEDGMPASWKAKLATPLVDLVTFAAYFFLLPVLINRMAARDAGNIVLVAGGYFVMCAGILVSKWLEPNPDLLKPAEKPETQEKEHIPQKPKKTESRVRKNNVGSLTLFLAWPYAAFVIVMLAESAGVFEEGSSLGARVDQLVQGGPLGGGLFVLGFLTMLLLFPLLLFIRPRPKVALGSGKHIIGRLFSVSAVNFMVLVTTAYWEGQLVDSEPMDVALGGKILIFIFAYPVFLMFYSPPRLALLSMEPGRWTYTGFAILLGYTVIRLMS